VLKCFGIELAQRVNDDLLFIDLDSNAQVISEVIRAATSALKPQAMIFDMDGVLADVSNSFRQAILNTARHFGAPATPADIKEIKAKGDANNDWIVSQRLLAKYNIDIPLEEVTQRFEYYYQGGEGQSGLKFTETLIPPRKFLADLASSYPMAIVTGRPRVDSDWFLAHADIAEFFQTAICMEDGPLKPRPEPVLAALKALGVETGWMFGDTPDDIVSACKAGLVAIGSAAPCDDFETAQDLLTSCGAAAVVRTVDQIVEFLP
jgi:HAD superfamily hydrolase (TIGR01548 family)